MAFFSFKEVIEQVNLPKPGFENLTISPRKVMDDLELILLLCSIGIQLSSSIEIKTINSADEDGYTIILRVSDGESHKISKVIIDVCLTIGPTWKQYLNVTYNDGVDCDVKIIVYPEPDWPKDFKYYENITPVSSLVKINNSCSVGTYLVLRENNPLFGPYTIVSKPEDVDKMSLRELPNKREVEEVEFLISYCGYDTVNADFAEDLCIDDLFPRFQVGDDLLMIPRWTDTGLYFTLETQTNDQETEWLWEHKKNDFEEHYGYPPILQSSKGGLRSLAVKVNDTHFRQVSNSPPEKKFEFVGRIEKQRKEFMDMTETFLNECDWGRNVVHPPVITRFILWDPNKFAEVIKGLVEHLRLRLPKGNRCYWYFGRNKEELYIDWTMTGAFLARKGFNPPAVMELVQEYVDLDEYSEWDFANHFDLDEFRKQLGLNEKREHVS